MTNKVVIRIRTNFVTILMRLRRALARARAAAQRRIMITSGIAWGFPITGTRVSESLGNFGAEDGWLIPHMDVRLGTDATTALNGLRDRMTNGPVEASTALLCDALTGAPQVWALDIRLLHDDVQLYIEDGEVFVVNLDRTDAPRAPDRFRDPGVNQEEGG
ncbi:hypothetical protein [Stenotrophomonas cyclobalanopsidis]|uniref:hypothetical protein n=1 Tax=Stenotrophomonas cyclobalanopsidis TaxID=2771362 RepID=UPI0034611AD7